MNTIDFGRRTVQFSGSRVSAVASVRGILAVTAVVIAGLVLAIIALGIGDFAVAPDRVIAALLGAGTPRDSLVVVEWRLPRVVAALMFGAALGIAGAIFQSLTRNPLGSPDVIGFDMGAYTGALLVMTLGSFGYVSTALGAIGGGLAAALLVYALAWKRGFHGFRLIIVGIGVSAMLASFNSWIILNADLRVAIIASAWGSGSLNGVAWPQLTAAALFLVPLVIAAALLSRRMSLLELGDDAAAALGVRTGTVRMALVVVGVAFTAVVTALAGPIAFVALAAPQIARRVTGSAGVSLAGSAAMGALLLLISDVAAQRLFAPSQLPVGIVTVAVGGNYLIWLLIREAKKR